MAGLAWMGTGLWGCGEQSSLSFQVQASVPGAAAAVAPVLEKRFAQLKSGWFSSVQAQAQGDRVRVQFSGWSPAPEQAQALAQSAGRLALHLLDDAARPLATEADVEDAVPTMNGNQPALALRLRAEAGERLAQRTQQAVGQEALLAWNGRPLQRLRISAPLGRQIVLNVPTLQDATLMSAALIGGSLPEGVAVSALP